MILTDKDREVIQQMIDHHREALTYLDRSDVKNSMGYDRRVNLYFHQDAVVTLEKLKQP